MKLARRASPGNIAKILDVLSATPGRLQALTDSLPEEAQAVPLAPGDWSFAEILAHLNACAELSTHAIFYALLVDGPTLPDVHPQRNWQKRIRYDQFSFQELLASFTFRRKVLLAQLQALQPDQWERPVRREGKRQEMVYTLARTLALHEEDHLNHLESHHLK